MERETGIEPATSSLGRLNRHCPCWILRTYGCKSRHSRVVSAQNPHKPFESSLRLLGVHVSERGARPGQLIHVAVRVGLAVEVAIEVHRQLDRRVAHLLLYVVWRRPTVQQQARE